MHISTSFVQDSRHASKSPKFVPVQPSGIAAVLADHGFDLANLKSGRARHADKADHQTTIAYYSARDSSDLAAIMGHGSRLDILVRAPHLTGAIEFRLGFFRIACANQWNSGSVLAHVRIAHMGDCLEQLNRAIPSLVNQRGQLVETIRAMSGRRLQAPELAQLTRRVADLRLAGSEARDVQVADLLTLRRDADTRADLFSVANVLQENALRFGLRYVSPEDRNLRTRNIDGTARGVELTGSIWEEATRLLAA